MMAHEVAALVVQLADGDGRVDRGKLREAARSITSDRPIPRARPRLDEDAHLERERDTQDRRSWLAFKQSMEQRSHAAKLKRGSSDGSLTSKKLQKQLACLENLGAISRVGSDLVVVTDWSTLTDIIQERR